MSPRHAEAPSLPAGTRIEFEVECRSSPNAAGEHHAAVLLENWTVVTPHDIPAEETAVALGGFCDCLSLADSGIRVAQRWWRLATRQAVPEIAFSPLFGWQPSVAPGCDCTPALDTDGRGLRFRTAQDVLEHEMGARHLAARHRARPHHVAALVDALHPLATDARPTRRAWEAVADRLREPDALGVLWDCGLHPAEVAQLLDVADSATGRVPCALPLGLAYVPDRAKSRRHEVRRQRDADLASWLVWDGTAPDARHPVECGEWLGLGLTPEESRAMIQAGATSAAADTLATAFGEPAEDAARRLLAWVRVGALPGVGDLVRLGCHRLAPSADEVSLARAFLSDEQAADVPPTLLALLVSERGSAAAAAEELSSSIAVGGPRHTHRLDDSHDRDTLQEELDDHPHPR